MLDDVSKVASAVEIAKRTFFIAKQSILVGIFISIVLMIIFSTGKFKPIYGALLQEVVDVIVIFNALQSTRCVAKNSRLVKQKTCYRAFKISKTVRGIRRSSDPNGAIASTIATSSGITIKLITARFI